MNDFKRKLSSLDYFQMEEVYEDIIDYLWDEYENSAASYKVISTKSRNLDEYISDLWNPNLTDSDIEIINSLTVNQKTYFDNLIINSIKKLNYI